MRAVRTIIFAAERAQISAMRQKTKDYILNTHTFGGPNACVVTAGFGGLISDEKDREFRLANLLDNLKIILIGGNLEERIFMSWRGV